MIKLISCYICGEDCRDWGNLYTSCCDLCSYDVMLKAGETPELKANGFGEEYDYALQAVKARSKLTVKVNNESKKKTYTDECPCGLHPSQCDYHR